MVYTIPNKADAGFADQSEWDKVGLEIIMEGLQGNGVISGCAVTAQGTPDMTVAVASGAIANAFARVAVTGGNVTIEAADGSNPRIDFVMVNKTSGALVNPTAGDGKGTAAAEPVYPALPANRVVLAAVYVPASDTDIDANQITDKGVPVPQKSGLLHSDPVEAAISNVSGWQTIATYTIPAGHVTLNCAIDIMLSFGLLQNSGSSQTGKLRVSIGGVATEGSSLTIGDSSARAEGFLHMRVVPEDSSNFEVGGKYHIGPQLGTWHVVDQPTGLSSWLGTSAVPYAGADLTTGTVEIKLEWDFSAAHANYEITRRFFTVEIKPAP